MKISTRLLRTPERLLNKKDNASCICVAITYYQSFKNCFYGSQIRWQIAKQHKALASTEWLKAIGRTMNVVSKIDYDIMPKPCVSLWCINLPDLYSEPFLRGVNISAFIIELKNGFKNSKYHRSQIPCITQVRFLFAFCEKGIYETLYIWL